jgi:hypothetical protein
LEEVLAGIGNTIGVYVKSSEATKQRRYTSYACICVYLNIAKPLLGSIILEYHDEDWMQTIDYEHIPFRCRKCHEHGHLFRECPLNVVHKEGNSEAGKDRDGYILASGKRRQEGRKHVTQTNKDLSTSNKYEILQDQPENPSDPQNPKYFQKESAPQQIGTGGKGPIQEKDPRNSTIDPDIRMESHLEQEDRDAKMDLDEQELAGVDLEHIEHAYRHHKLYTITPDQLRKVHKVFLNSSAGSTARSSKGLEYRVISQRVRLNHRKMKRKGEGNQQTSLYKR